jgi:hypothetical protein
MKRSSMERLVLAVVALFFLAAPTAGDIGCFATSPAELDPNKFFLAKQADDCAACEDCSFTTNYCKAACGPPMGGSFPPLCYPLVQDGEVCLHALEATSCDDYASYVSDQGPTVPTECDFCPPRDAGSE